MNMQALKKEKALATVPYAVKTKHKYSLAADPEGFIHGRK
jgi:hypothetical protein